MDGGGLLRLTNESEGIDPFNLLNSFANTLPHLLPANPSNLYLSSSTQGWEVYKLTKAYAKNNLSTELSIGGIVVKSHTDKDGIELLTEIKVKYMTC